MKFVALLFVAGLLMASLVAAAETLDLEKETLYCDHFDISAWCYKGGIEFLSNLTPDQLAYYHYFNDYAFSDDLRYNGLLRITSINVVSDITTTSAVEAFYKIQNYGDQNIDVEIAALNTPENTLSYVNGQQVDADPLLDGLKVSFAPNEEKEINFVFSEPLYGDIYGYNVNLLFDNKTVDSHITPAGTFTFKLPSGASLKQCVPSGYTKKTEGGRIVIAWQKKDFLPWTNPFNDLICRWSVGQTSQGNTTGDSGQQPASGGNNMIWIIAIIVLLACLFMAYKRGMLDRFLNR